MKKKLLIRAFIFTVAGILFTNSVFAQTADTSAGNDASVQSKLDELLVTLSNVSSQLRSIKDPKSHRAAIKIKLIKRKIVKAVNSIPPEKCLGKLKIAMNDFYALVSKLGQGIACGPPIIPPFLQVANPPISPDCALPPEDVVPDQIDPGFSESLGAYDTARDIFHIDSNSNEIPDACEGDLGSSNL